MTFTKDVFSQLISFVNKNSLENGCNLPDFVIARHLEASYFSLCKTMQDMANFYGVPEGHAGAPAWSERLLTEELPNLFPINKWVEGVSEVTADVPEGTKSWTLSGGGITPLTGEDWEKLAQDSALTHMTETEDTDAEALLGEIPTIPIVMVPVEDSTISVDSVDAYGVFITNGRLNISGKATAKQIQWGLEQLGLQEVAAKINGADCSGSCSNGIEDEG